MVTKRNTAVVTVGVADMVSEPSHQAERLTQALLNTPLTYTEASDAWVHAHLPDYEGWMRWQDIGAPPLKGFTRIGESCGSALDLAIIVNTPRAPLYTGPEGDETADHVYLSTRLPLLDMTHPQRLQVALPDEDSAWIERSAVSIRRTAESHPRASASSIISYARMLLGTPYLWGGTTADGLDCSGFVQLCLRMGGYDVPRDADQQHDALPHTIERAAMREGDLIFFGARQITHVAIALNEHEYIHAEGQRHGRVLINSFAVDASLYDARLANIVYACKRVIVE